MDMSAALTNPYTLDRFDVVRRAQTVNGYGEADNSNATVPGVFGVVYTVGEGGKLTRAAEAQSVSKSLMFITKYAIRTASGPVKAPAQAYQADALVWNGTWYVVTSIDDYSHWGTGFIGAHAEALPRTQIPPVTK